MKLKTILAGIASLGLISAGLALPARAAGGTIDLVNTSDTLSGSTISGFDPTATLRLGIISSMGSVTWASNGSGANLVSNGGNKAQGVWLEGTQAQLNAALGEVSVNKPCSGTYKIYAQVTDSGLVQDPVSSHHYKLSPNNNDLEPAIADAAGTPLVPGASDTFGYLATVTNETENIIVSQFFGQGWLPATDRDVEGDWKWITGPEAGTSFYSGNANAGGAVINGKFAGWASGEPNDYNNGEDYAEIMGNGQWNDTSMYSHSYTIEWGGMPGDDLSSASIASDSIDISVTGAFTGAGTEGSPYLIPDATALYAVAPCGGPNVHFKQTANITLPSNWSGDQAFAGHYEGDGKTIAFSANTPVHNDFGVWANAGQNNRAYISDLKVTGDLNSAGFYRVGLLVGTADNVDFTNIIVDGSLTAGGGRWGIGGLAGVYYNGTADYVTSTVSIAFEGDNYSVGGIAGEMNALLDHSTWSGAITSPPSVVADSVGGLVGAMDCGTIRNSTSSGTIVADAGNDIGGLVGYSCGEILDSSSSVDITAPNSDYVGGAIGTGDCTEVVQVSATGDVSGNTYVGGLMGYNCSDTEGVYARGNVSGNDYVGSLIGEANGYVSYAYATGSVTTTGSNSRGWAGGVSGNLNSVHWVPSQSTIGEPVSLLGGEVPFTVADATSFGYYTQDGWDISNNWGDGATWTICSATNDGYPILTGGYTQDPCSIAQTLTPTPLISGTGVVGSKFTGESGIWDAGVALTFAWLLDGIVIPNKTASTYSPVSGDVGKTLTFQVTSTKSGYLTVVKTSSGKLVTAKPVVVIVKPSLEVTIGEFAGNSWWTPFGFVPAIKAAVKAHSKATSVTCVGIVAPGGSKAWQKTLGLKRAALACSTAKLFNSKLKTTLSWKVSATKDKVRRGATLKFNK